MLNSMESETFGQRLKRLRLASGKSQRKLAAEAGLSNGTISQAESDTIWVGQSPSTDIVRRLARALGVEIDVLAPDPDALILVIPPRPRHLTERELYERFGIRPYDQPIAIEGIAVSAGPGAGVPQGIDETIPRRVKGSKYLWEAPVVGACMADEINPGEMVIYSTRLSAEIGKVMVALRDEEELIIKRLKLAGDTQVLRPNHGKDVPVDERIRFLGRGVSVQRPLL